MMPHLPRFYHNDTLLYYILSTLDNTNCKLPEDGVLTPKHVGVIQYKFTLLICAYECKKTLNELNFYPQNAVQFSVIIGRKSIYLLKQS
jgi:hypothetical protein